MTADALTLATNRMLAPPRGTAPMLLVVIHTEEEFDWSAPFDRSATGITHLREIGRVQEIFDRHGAKPTYVLDYPVAAQDEGIAAIKAVTKGRVSAIGAHLHPWVSPPFTEAISAFHSYPGNLPATLEREKLRQLTEVIASAFGSRPNTYLAGRYGTGPHTLSALQALGYKVDLSAVAMSDFRADGGPDYRIRDNCSYWEGSPPILRIPHSVADVGFLCRGGRRLLDADRSPVASVLRLPSLLARAHAVERVRLTPEGFMLRHLKRATRALIGAGNRVLLFSFHSPSVAPGNTPYVRSHAQLQQFLDRVDGFLRFFREEIQGIFVTPDDLLRSTHEL